MSVCTNALTHVFNMTSYNSSQMENVLFAKMEQMSFYLGLQRLLHRLHESCWLRLMVIYIHINQQRFKRIFVFFFWPVLLISNHSAVIIHSSFPENVFHILISIKVTQRKLCSPRSIFYSTSCLSAMSALHSTNYYDIIFSEGYGHEP